MSLSSVLNKINGPRLEEFGVVATALSACFYGHGYAGLVVFALLIFFVLASTSNKFQLLLTKTVGRFAKVPAWPKYVSLALIILVAAYHGHLTGLATIAFVLAIGVGILFDQLY